ncbi:hypothetical protein ACT2E5_09620 [Burkholderia vietnamiensis]|uniref:hypothetical protein n=1 Tax=Burkholderia TaxID=32008 RepID=UPI00163FE029|nr:hypothetical protein [Burkholderia gladioli]
MSEFNNRIAAQRDILEIVNGAQWSEELFGLSSGAIDRWLHRNSVSTESQLAILIEKAAGTLFFLSNKSQEQITEEYKNLSLEVKSITEQIRAEVIALRT